MTADQIICKIARTAQKDTIGGFEYFGKCWWPLSFITDKIETIISSSFRNAALKEVKNATTGELFLALVYRRVGVAELREELLPVLFKNYSAHARLAATAAAVEAEGEQQVHKLGIKFVTTRLYDCLWQSHETAGSNGAVVEGDLQLPTSFQPILCHYQQRAVQWMLRRETEVVLSPAFYTQLQAKDEESIVYEHLYCEELLKHAPPQLALPPGGILADEMGLGKTVEVIALILLHPRHFVENPSFLESYELKVIPQKVRRKESVVFCVCGSTSTTSSLVKCCKCEQQQHVACVTKHNDAHSHTVNDPYFCPNCWDLVTAKSPEALVQTRATFIVTPYAIKQQWQTELARHIQPELRVLVYDGVASTKWISPLQLADYDVVLTDYNVLRQEIYHSTAYATERITRNKPRFMRLPTPLLMVQWWRVCLDEAQMVESNASHVTALVRMLPAVNRWAVTGTPIQRSIDDLRSLLVFVGFHAACEPAAAWNNLVCDFVRHQQATVSVPQRPLIDLLHYCMWRTSKTKVADELHIPPQTQVLHFIRLSNLEQLFYVEQHEVCEQKFNETINKYIRCPDRAHTISLDIMRLILQPLLKLRQSCNIPVIVDGKHNSTSATHKHFLQPKELHSHLKSTNELECKAELRSMASSYNGMGAIYFIRRNYEEAIKQYELVLKMARDYKDTSYTVDSLLQIHALHNIVQASSNSLAKGATTISSEMMADYEQQCYALEWKYLEQQATTLNSAKRGAEAALSSYNAIIAQTDSDLSEFVSLVVEVVAEHSNADQLMDRIQLDCLALFANKPTMQAVHSIGGVLYVVSKWCEKVTKTQHSLNAEFEHLRFFTEQVRARNEVSAQTWSRMMEFTADVYDCHLSELREKPQNNDKAKEKEREKSAKQRKKLCKLCTLRDELNSFECLLFNKVIDKETNQTDGLSMPAPEIALIKTILAFRKSSHRRTEDTEELRLLDKHLESIDCLQAIYKKWIKFWIEIEYTVKAYDELDMCKMRMSLTDNEEEKNNYRVAEHELGNIFMEQQMNLQSAQYQFAIKLARLKYIMHLEGNVDPGACPICHSDEESRYVVLECGHHICLSCLRQMQQLAKTQKLTCAICRYQQSSKKVYYVTRVSNGAEEEDATVLGNYSSKITFIVRLIRRLCSRQQSAKDDAAKILIFSTWQPILSAIAAALKENSISHRQQYSPRTIEEFKNPKLGITCLLMTFVQGSKGLNLIEANHVFLVEPILNPGEELQAVGRVHRFGQTKPTTVHRFIIKGTIEENVYNVVTNGTKSQSSWEFDNTSLDSLRNLFKLHNCITEDL